MIQKIFGPQVHAVDKICHFPTEAAFGGPDGVEMNVLVGSNAGALAALGVQAAYVLLKYLQLRWRVQQEHAHRRFLESVARSLPAGSRLEEIGQDGTLLRLSIAPEQAKAGSAVE